MITTEKITGWRCWEVYENKELRSIVYGAYIWYPKITQTLYPGEKIAKDNKQGLHCYKTRAGCDEWASFSTASGMTLQHPLVIGTIEIWGTIWEHETGYRAQYAKIKSLDEAISCWEPAPALLKSLQELYFT